MYDCFYWSDTCLSCFYTILHVLIIAKYMIKIHFTYPSRWMLFLQALCMHPCHEEHRGQTKPSGLNWNKIINQIKSTYINIYAVCREGIFISLSIHLRLILTEAYDNYDVHAHDGTRPLLGPIYDYLERVLYNRLIYSLTYLERILSVLCSDLNNHFHEEWNWKLKVNASLCLVERQSESNFSVEGNDNSGQSWLFIYHFTCF